MSDDSTTDTSTEGQGNEVSSSDLGLTDAEAQQLLADAIARGDAEPAATAGTDEPDWKAEAEKWRTLARKHEDRAKQNAQAATKAKTVEQQLADLQAQLAERDKRDVERSGRLAMSRLDAHLAEAGIKREDVQGLLKRIKGSDLLTNGEPDDAAIGELAESLKKIAGRATPDPDQGAKGGKGPLDMNALIRRAAGVTS
jgi:hypothetical protein